MKNNFILYLILALMFLPPLLLFVPVIFLLIILAIPLVPQFFSFWVIDKTTEAIVQDEIKIKKISMLSVFVNILIIISIIVIVKLNGFMSALAYVIYALGVNAVAKNNQFKIRCKNEIKNK